MPGPTTDVIIPNGKTSYPSLNITSASCRTLTIQSGSSNPSLTIPLGKTLTVGASTGAAVSNAGLLKVDGILVVKGNVVNNGTVTSATGTVRFTNTNNIDVTGTGTTSLYDVTFAGTGLTRFGFTSTLTNPVAIAHRALLQVSPASATGGDVQANGKVRFTSSAVGGATPSTPCGYVFLGGGGGKLTGVITVERAISSVYNRGDGYRHYSTPVSAPAFTSLATTGTGAFTPALNTGYEYPRDYRLAPPNVQAYNENLVPAVPASGFDAFSYGWRSPSTTTMETGRGYTLLINAAAKVALTGTANTGPYATYPLTRGSNAEAGWNFVGNPYPTPIDIFKVMTDNLYDDDPAHTDTYNPNGFDGTVYFFRSSFNTNYPYLGSYQSINVTGAGSSDSLTQLFPVMQGFFVRKTVSTAYADQAYQFNDAQRADPADVVTYPSGTLTPFFRAASASAPAAAPWLFRLAVTDSKTKAVDNTTVGFRADATPGFDHRYDALRPGDNIGMPTTFTVNAANESCMMNFLPTLTTTLTVPVGLKTLVPGRTYTLAAPAKQLVPANTRVWLEDRVGGKAVELTAGQAVTFTAETTQYAHRFFLRFEPTAAPAVAAERLEVAVYPNPSLTDQVLQVSANKMSGPTATATLINAFGQSVKTVQIPVRDGLLNAEVPTAGLPAGVYLLRVSAEAGITTRRIEIR